MPNRASDSRPFISPGHSAAQPQAPYLGAKYITCGSHSHKRFFFCISPSGHPHSFNRSSANGKSASVIWKAWSRYWAKQTSQREFSSSFHWEFWLNDRKCSNGPWHSQTCRLRVLTPWILKSRALLSWYVVELPWTNEYFNSPKVLDWLLTLDLEVSLMWPAKWNVTKTLYFLARYSPFIDTSVVMYRKLS